MYTIIGWGRVARHISHYFRIEKIPFRIWSRRRPQKKEPEWRSDLVDALRGCSHVLLLVSDGAVEECIRSTPALRGKTLVHFSGSLVSPLACGAHPLMTFAGELYPVQTYRAVTFILERGRPGFQELLPGLNNPHFYIEAEQKPLYHSLCVLSGNFTTILWSKFLEELEGTLGVPAEAAYPYLRQVARNLERGGEPPLTGPLARGDWETVRRNLEALSGDPFEAIYRAFAEAFRSGLPCGGGEGA